MPDKKLLIVFAKPPVAGFAKTRLIPALGEHGAASLYGRLLKKTLDSVCHNNDWDVQLWLANNLMPDYISELKNKYAISAKYQQGHDLGERMFHAITNSLRHYKKVALIGTDCPAIDQHLISNTFAMLDEVDLVFSPAEDGGYVQIAARKIEKAVFDQVEWGSELVLSQTKVNIKQTTLSVAFTKTYWDVDTPQDLKRLKKEYYALAKDLPLESVFDSAP